MIVWTGVKRMDEPDHSVGVREYFGSNSRYLRATCNMKVRAEVVRQLVGSPTDADILDVGCGDGSISRGFLERGNRLTFLDVSEPMLTLAKKHCSLRQDAHAYFVCANFLDFPLLRQYDVIMCIGLLAHVVSIDRCLEQVARALKPGGCFIAQWTESDRLLTKFVRLVRATRDRVRQQRRYMMNVTQSGAIISSAGQHELQITKMTRYSLMLPGMGILPERWLYRYLRLTVDNAFTEPFATEVVAKFVRL